MKTTIQKIDFILNYGSINKYQNSFEFIAWKAIFPFKSFEVETNDINIFINNLYDKINKLDYSLLD